MSRIILICCVAALFIFPSFALSQSSLVSYVAVNGSDGSNCSAATPCRSFGRALSVTAVGGTIIAEGSGAYPGFTINKSVSIVADVYAEIGALNTDAIDINAGPNATVILRGLAVKGTNDGGIVANSIGELHVEHCVISGFSYGISFNATNGLLFVYDSTFDDDNRALYITTAATTTIEHVHIAAGKFGVEVLAGPATVRNSYVANLATGYYSEGAATDLTIDSSLAENDGTGVFAASGSTIRLINSTITKNQTGLFNDGVSSLRSFGDNNIDGNVDDGLGAITSTVNKH